MEKLSHAYIIAGPREAGEKRAMLLAQTLLCADPGHAPCGACGHCRKVLADIHPDVIHIRRLMTESGKLRQGILIDQVREMIGTSLLLPNEAAKKVYIIHEAGTMEQRTQNTLLKILEEPPPFVAILLLADNPWQMLETVRSRCVSIVLNSGEEEQELCEHAAERFLALCAAGDAAELCAFMEDAGGMKQGDLQGFARAGLARIADMLCGRADAGALSHTQLFRLTEDFRRVEDYAAQNVGVKHALGMLTAGFLLPETRN